jgi:hypothetical protein
MGVVAFGVATASAMPAHADASGAPSLSVPPPLDVHHAPQPQPELTYREVLPQPTLVWFAMQLLPSPEVAFGRQRHIDFAGTVDDSIKPAWGLRWQLSPLVWSFGVNRRQSRWRFFVVDPIARHSGSLELSGSFEYIGGDVNGVIVRPGARVYLPVSHRGENLSVSLGTSVYRFDGFRVAYDVGAYVLSGFLGLQLTVAPSHAPLAAIATVRIRYF